MPETVLPSRDALTLWHFRAKRARPFLRWAGGKQAFLQRFGHLIPEFIRGQYLEPFLGSGALFFHVMRTQPKPCTARLGDTNSELVRCFLTVRDDPDGVYERLRVLQAGYSAAADKAGFYYQLRDSYNSMRPRVDAATFMVLNRLCWNGLYRVNREGKFNVPFGAPKTDRIAPSLDELLNASAALKQAGIRATSWENTLAFAEPGDFVFLDPPYFSDLVSDEAKYQKRPFSLRHHERVASSLRSLDLLGVDFLLTNSAEPEMVDLYRSYELRVEEIEMNRPINSKTDRRGPVNEIVVRPSSTGGAG